MGKDWGLGRQYRMKKLVEFIFNSDDVRAIVEVIFRMTGKGPRSSHS